VTAVNSTWLIGSFTLANNATIVINGNDAVISADTYYLRHATAGLSLIAAIQTALQVHVPSVSVYIGKDRKLHIAAGVTLTLAVATALQDETGLPAAPTPSASITASFISTLLWSPSYPERAVGMPSGVTGRKVYDRKQSASPSGLTTRTTLHHSTTLARWTWSAVPQARAWTTDAGVPGEYHRFWLDVLNPGYRFQLYPGASMVEDSAVTTTVSWPTALGPYVARDLDSEWYRRMIENSDTWVDIELLAHVVTELS
jgi:hypothetical protein